jgi:hypothetical protein
MLSDSETMERAMQEKTWPEIAAMARSLQIRLEKGDDEAKNLEARLRVIKQALIEHMEHPGMDSRVSDLYYSLSILMNSLEEDLMKHDIERHEFISFLRALLAKLKTEKAKPRPPKPSAFTRHKR